MGELTSRAQQVLDLLVELTYEDDNTTLTDLLFELLYDKSFEDGVHEALEKRGYEVMKIKQ